jgi:hypothetical protein
MKVGLVLIVSVFLFSCSVSKFNLEKMESKKVMFNKLPDKVKSIYEDHAINNALSFDIVTKSLDKGYKISYEYTGDENPYQSSKPNNNVAIKINNNLFEMSMNYGGHPFVLYNKILYMAYELNLDKINYNKSEYLVINLSKELNK